MNRSLFRNEAIRAKSDYQYGRALIKTPKLLSYLIVTLLSFFIISLVVVSLSTYSRKVSVRGILMPLHGEIKVYSEISGIIDSVLVEGGGYVDEEQPLFEIKRSLIDEQGVDYNKAKLNELQRQKSLLKKTIKETRQLFESDRSVSKIQLKSLKMELAKLKELLALENEQKSVLQEQLSNISDLVSKGHASKKLSWDYEKNIVAQRVKIKATEGNIVKLESQVHQLELEGVATINSNSIKINNLEKELSLIETSLLDSRMKNNVRIVSPVSGHVSFLQVHKGQKIDQNLLLATILPKKNQLIAEVQVPSSAISELYPGKLVKIKFDAFPYQEFGLFDGQVIEVSSSVLKPEEIVAQLKPVVPVYLVKVELEDERIVRKGKSYELQSGMLLDAEVIIETMQIIDWFINTLFNRN
ncbi:HlyD family secretion protein [Pleionea sp. CnH1-48]|uniref:HlyD family secretion protein n=1 Tax=Pleionea sp. CnH1-48 TaxID=2954494 RepID=UPI0020981307|nr:HlyD family efflux transporter periplasmic adaptor subunit [Pleionea sp. CnH1-48]MCO7224309.1 HlyD family secretion protein [Pleionea sp. CnH1-48]